MPDAAAVPPENPYSASRIRRGFLHFLIGKGLTSVAGIGTMLLMVRAMTVEDFAKYSILFGLVEVISAVAGVGILHVLARYVPEAYAQHLHAVTRRLIIGLVALRVLVLAFVLVFIHQTMHLTSGWIGLDGWEWAIEFYLIVILVRTVTTTFFNVLESLLQQGYAQFGFSTVTIVRFGILAWLASQGSIDLHTVILVELITDVLGLAIMLAGLLRTMPSGGEPGRGWIRNNRDRMMKFGLQGYVQHLLLVPFGSSTDRLLVGGRLPVGDIAMFGFAQNLADLVNRYLPAQMFVGLIRPVLTARFASGKGFAELQMVCNLFLKLNLFLIGGATVGLFAGGRQLADALTGNKDFPQLLPLLLVMCLLMALYSWRHVLDLVTHTLERVGPLIACHTVMNLSVIPGFLLMPYWGVFALPISHVVGVLAGCWMLLAMLARQGFRYRHDLRGLWRLGAAMLLAMGLSLAVEPWIPWLVRAIICGFAYIGFSVLLRVLSGTERNTIIEILRRRSAQS